jgi:brefeldin A-inhibited guanine nucleotide-exchange protein
MIKALRGLIELFTHYFKTLERMLDMLLELLVSCICQGIPLCIISSL